MPVGKPAPPRPRNPLAFALWVRMLFSCLVDADFLDTEAFMSPTRSAARAAVPTLDAMGRVFDQWIAERDQAIVERDRWIADRDQWIAERLNHRT